MKICKENGCGSQSKAKGMCRRHWRLWRHGQGVVCRIDDCERPIDAKGLCSAHYRRMRTYGNTMEWMEVQPGNKNNWKYGSPALRFFTNINWSDVGENSCWVWVGACNGAYPMLSDQDARLGVRTAGAHRFSYDRWVGEIPSGWHVDHLCGNQHCVNPGHLEAVPAQVNILRGMADSIREKYGEAALAAEAEQLLAEVRGDRNRSGYWYGVAEQL